MQHVACPGCGAPVEFKSPASVLAVCGYCKTTVLKDADSVRDLGKMSDVLEDYSPLQIGTSGVFEGQGFAVIGRIQMRYSEGFWNEWYVMTDSGDAGWLADASNQFTMTFEKPATVPMPAFEAIRPGSSLIVAEQPYSASDVRTAQCTGGQGELPFQVGPGWQAKVADFRCGLRFLTLDYSDGPAPKVYVGRAVTLTEMKAQLLREDAQIEASAGRVKGKVTQLACPSCSSPVSVSPGMTSHFICPSCHAQVDVSGSTAVVLAAASRLAAAPFTLELGSTATIDGASYTLLGAMRRSEIADLTSSWNEYLLYGPSSGFVWLVETKEGWQRSQVLDDWPIWAVPDQAVLDGRSYRKFATYGARVTFAVGAFNWRVAVGDTAQVAEFRDGQISLAAEATSAELTWSRSRPIAVDQIRAWFGEEIHRDLHQSPSYTRTARWLIIGLVVLNAIPLLLAPASALFFVVVAALAIYLPAYFLDKLEAAP